MFPAMIHQSVANASTMCNAQPKIILWAKVLIGPISLSSYSLETLLTFISNL